MTLAELAFSFLLGAMIVAGSVVVLLNIQRVQDEKSAARRATADLHRSWRALADQQRQDAEPAPRQRSHLRVVKDQDR